MRNLMKHFVKVKKLIITHVPQTLIFQSDATFDFRILAEFKILTVQESFIRVLSFFCF